MSIEGYVKPGFEQVYAAFQNNCHSRAGLRQTHLAHVYRKLGIRRRWELIADETTRFFLAFYERIPAPTPSARRILVAARVADERPAWSMRLLQKIWQVGHAADPLDPLAVRENDAAIRQHMHFECRLRHVPVVREVAAHQCRDGLVCGRADEVGDA
jgi:hypothetical protein